MKSMKTIALVLLMVCSIARNVAAKEIEPKFGLWERFCVKNKIADACKKAARSLSSKIIDSQSYEIAELRVRLKNVATIGCRLRGHSSCKLLEDIETGSFNAEDLIEQETEYSANI